METGNEDAPKTGLHIRLFGAFEARINDALIPPLRSRKVQWLLALLVLRHDQPLDRVWLAGTLWPDSAPDQALYNLRQSLSNLRHALSGTGVRFEAPAVNAVSLNLAKTTADVIAFDAAIVSGTRASLEHAVALYRGPLLEGCVEEWALTERRVREESCLNALTALADQALADGKGSAAVKYLQSAVRADPLREQTQRALLRALVAVGDYGAVVQAYRDLRILLRRELNADPDPETTTLFQRIRRDARSLASTPPHSLPTSPSSPPEQRLPSSLTPLVGRRSELEQIVTTLRAARLLTLTGPGGVGKTRLAIAAAEQIAAEYAEGVFFVDLAPLSDPALIAQSVAGALQVREETNRPLLVTLQEHLRAKSLLLVLDNCEHLLDPCARLADTLLQNCPGVRILATSRQILGLMGETGWIVPPLTTPPLSERDSKAGQSEKEWLSLLSEYEAVELFVTRAQQALPTFQMSAHNAAAIARICAHLDGIPLALELAAARMRLLSVEDISLRLDNRFRLLTGGSRAARPRQQTLRALIDWSYDLLNDRERMLLCRLAVFAGGWTLQAAEEVCGGEIVEQQAGESMEEWETLDVLTSLVEKSLVQVEAQAGSHRYRMLETVRLYAAERLHLSGKAALAQSRHENYFLALAEAAEPQLAGPEQALWLDRLEREHDNLRAVLEREQSEAALRLSGALGRFWMVRGYLSEGRERLMAALSRPEARVPTGTRAKALNSAGTLARQQGDYPSAQKLYEESLAIWRELRDTPGIAAASGSLGTMAWTRGDYAAARTLYEESLEIQRQRGDKQSIVVLLNGLSAVAYSQGDYPNARRYAEESLAMRQELGDRLGIARSMGVLGTLAGSQGDYLSARRFLAESLAIRRDLGDRQGIAWSLDSLGKVACALSEYALAQALHEESLLLQRELGDRYGIAGSLTGLGAVAYSQGQYPAAHSLYRESLIIRQELADRQGIAESLEAYARLAVEEGQATRAVTIWAADATLRENLGSPWEPKDREDHSRSLHSLRENLPEQVFAAAWTEGQTMTLEQVIGLALDDTLETGYGRFTCAPAVAPDVSAAEEPTP